MTRITLQTDVHAPIGRCFDLARSMDFHTRSMRSTGERVVGGRAAGLIGLNEEVEFEARHLGLTRRLRARIAASEPPHRFVDEQVRGPFRSLRHEHRFETIGPGATRMTDSLDIDAGWSLAGLAAERLLIRPHLTRVLRQHQANLKAALESDEWRAFLAHH